MALRLGSTHVIPKVGDKLWPDVKVFILWARGLLWLGSGGRRLF